jgi:hypothetical protein
MPRNCPQARLGEVGEGDKEGVCLADRRNPLKLLNPAKAIQGNPSLCLGYVWFGSGWALPGWISLEPDWREAKGGALNICHSTL